MLSLSHLVKTFDNYTAVNDVSFNVASGERIALLGPNGAGKTTTLMMSLGVTIPDSGAVEINGITLHKNRAKALESVGFAAAYMTPPHTLKVRECLRIGAALAGLPIRTDRVDEMIERFEISRFVDRLGGELSSGQKTLVGIARAAISHPKLLILDEPTAYLDPAMSLKVREKIEQLCNDLGSSLLITSHNMRDIDHLCSRIVFLQRGQVRFDFAPNEMRALVGQDDLDELFIDLANEQQNESTSNV